MFDGQVVILRVGQPEMRIERQQRQALRSVENGRKRIGPRRQRIGKAGGKSRRANLNGFEPGWSAFGSLQRPAFTVVVGLKEDAVSGPNRPLATYPSDPRRCPGAEQRHYVRSGSGCSELQDRRGRRDPETPLVERLTEAGDEQRILVVDFVIRMRHFVPDAGVNGQMARRLVAFLRVEIVVDARIPRGKSPPPCRKTTGWPYSNAAMVSLNTTGGKTKNPFEAMPRTVFN